MPALPSEKSATNIGQTPRRRSDAPGVVWLALALTAGIVWLLLLNNWHYIFHAKLYETSDWASDSLFVRDAEHGVMLHGHYSRWGFYHPGPVLFYVMALGELIFYHGLHVVHTPLNGQSLAVWIAVALFFSFALSIFAKRLGAERGGYRFFLPLALLFAIWHYGSAESVHPFVETWPVCPPILVFLCFLVATASVASGGGRELPIVVVAGGWLVHNYIAQPLFVVPLTLLAYAGLLVSCRRPAGGPHHGDSRTGWQGSLTAGWRTFPRAHVVAGILLVLFVLPVLIDLFHGSQSNLSHVLAHIRQRPPEAPKTLGRSFCYFLTFGSYSAYNPALQYFGDYTAGGMRAFLATHWRAYLGWAVALVAPPILFALTRRQPPASGGAREAVESPQTPSTFIPWFYAVLATAFVLTLAWGMKQDGEMYYFNAYFDYSIYYGVALGLAAALAVFLQTMTAASGFTAGRPVLGTALWLGVATAALSGASHFQDIVADSPGERASARVVAAAAAATLPPGATCFLDCDPWDRWPVTIAVALQLDRLGYRVRVNDNWGVMFGAKRTFAHEPVDLSRPIVHWSILPLSRDPSRLSRWPVLMESGIQVAEIAALAPGEAGRIRFATDGNYASYAWFGWSPVSGDWTWSDQFNALLQFRPFPLPPENTKGVDVLLNAWSFADPKQPKAQRLELTLNGTALATVHLPTDPPPPDQYPVVVHISAEVWRAAQAQGVAKLLLRFPDAKSPYEIGLNSDTRPLGGAFRSIEFRPAE